MIVPDSIDKDVLIMNILMSGGEFEVLYSNGDFFKEAIGAWSKKYKYTFDKWASALSTSYKVLENYQRSENYKSVKSANNSKTDTITGTVDRTYRSSDHTDTNATNTEKVSAYDDSTFQNKSQTSAIGGSTGSNSGSDNVENSSSNKSVGSDSATITDNATITGMTGSKTPQEMLLQEIELAKFNLMKNIEDLFITEFCIMVYE